ncbi:MAG: hypothetical protein M3279_04125 [Actinomycetota bacterium]|nr:hypothetical protein [Actinomycetota bacterium]
MRPEERRKRTETNEAWVADHPIAAWILYAFVFSLVALMFELPDEDGVQWVRIATIGPTIAGAVVLASVFRHRRRRRSRDR